MNEFPRDKEARLLKLLGDEAAIFSKILELTGKQTELLAADDLEEFEKSLNQRQEFIEQINGLHQEAEALMQSYVSYSESTGRKKIAAIEQAIEKLRDVISECAGLNESNIAAAKEMTGEYVKRMDELNVGRKSLGAYAQNVPNNSELFDKKT